MPTPPSVSHQTYQYFVQEATELLKVMEEELQDIKQHFSLQKVYTLMRAAHTLKGASASVGLETLQKATHSLEDIFKALCYDDTVISEAVEQLLFEGYECVRLLMSAQLVGTHVDGDETLNRMARVIGQLQVLLGDRVGQSGRLPSSSELGFDMTESIFQMGVAQRIKALETALENPSPAGLRELLKTQAEVFMGLGESLNLPGFSAIAKMTHHAVEQYPDLILHIAPVALENFKSAQVTVLKGDRTQGGLPSIALQQFGGQFSSQGDVDSDGADSQANSQTNGEAKQQTLTQQPTTEPLTTNIQQSQQTAVNPSNRPRRSGWLKRQWQMLTSPIGTSTDASTDTSTEEQQTKQQPSQQQEATSPTVTAENSDAPSTHLNTDIKHDHRTPVQSGEIKANEIKANGTESKEQTHNTPANSTQANSTQAKKSKSAADSDLSELTPPELEGFNIQLTQANGTNTNGSTQYQPDANILGQLAPNLDGVAPLDIYDIQSDQPLPDQPLLSEQQALTSPSNLDSPLTKDISSDKTVRDQGNTTIRISTEHLEKLDQTMGELLTQQNRQTLYNEQLTGLVQKLLHRISTQQQQLNHQQTEYLIRKTLPGVLPTLGNKSETMPITEGTSLKKKLSLENNNNHYDNFDAIELERYSDIQLLLQSCLEETIQQSESAEAIELFVKQSEQALEKQKRLLSNTRETLLEARMVPLGTVLQQFPTVVERLKAYHQKLVDLTLEGGELLIDKAIADQLYEPLLHLVRNAFDHGIESPEERLDQNKAFTGHITIEGKQRGRHLIISVRDDGQGIDLESIRQKAVEHELITQTAADTLTTEQTTDLLFTPGFSTTAVPDALSGRGIGLDAVRAKVQALQGWVNVSHAPDSGTCFTLHIPTNLTIAKLLLCQAQGRIYALIADAVEHILIPTDKQIRKWKGGKVLTWQANQEEHLVSVSVLNEVLNYASPMSGNRPDYPLTARSRHTPSSKPSSYGRTGTGTGTGKRHLKQQPATNPVILLRQQNTLVGLEVDQLLGEQELVISPLGN
ncbi:MAG: ATP-binding protein, partial [Cyanobacteria bacterium J06650_10]